MDPTAYHGEEPKFLPSASKVSFAVLIEKIHFMSATLSDSTLIGVIDTTYDAIQLP